jgi:hypothetical protein
MFKRLMYHSIHSMSNELLLLLLLLLFVIFSGSGAQRWLWPRSRGFLIKHNDAPHSVELLWTRDQLVAETST